jgi:hypothetical protein
VLTLQGAGTNYLAQKFSNTGGNTYLGISNSAGGGFLSGSGNYSTGLLTESATNLVFGTANVKRQLIASNGDISFYEDTGTTAKFFWDASAESLGIGTSSTTAPLTIGYSGAEAQLLINNSGDSRMVYLGAFSANEGILRLFNSSNVETVRIPAESTTGVHTYFNAGNVGIGATAPESIVHIKDSGNVSTTLQIESAVSQYAPTINFDGIVGASADYLLGEINGSWDTHTNVVSAIRFESGADTTNKDDGLISFWTSSSGPTLAERMRIDSSGNVGIGTSSPFTKLEVTGDISGTWTSGANRFVGSQYLTGSDYQLGMKTTMDTRETKIFAKAADTGGYVTIATGITPSERLRVDGSGNVGIGKAVPAYILDIEGASPRMWMKDTTASGSHFEISADTSAVGLGNRANLPLILFTNNTERMRIDSSGNVGIGATDPAEKLQVNGNLMVGDDLTAGSFLDVIGAGGGDFGIRFGGEADRDAKAAILGTTTTASLRFFTAGANERMVINASGNVGIGTSSPQNILHTDSASTGEVVGLALSNSSGTFSANESVSIKFGVGSSTALAHGKILVANTDSGFGSNGYMAFYTRGSDSIAERMRIDSSGNVGIGCSPTTALQVGDGTDTTNWLRLTGTVSDLYIGQNTALAHFGQTNAAKLLSVANYPLAMGTANAYPVIFGTSDTERMRIDSSGNLLVGTTVSGARLTVKSNATAILGFGVYGDTTGDTAYNIAQFGKYDNDSTTSQVFINFVVNNGAIAQGQINANGAGAVAFGSWSDSRLKENITDLPSQLANITALRPVEFDYIESEGGGHQLGFIAQEVEEIYPDLVGERSDGMKTLSGLGKWEARLVKAIQEQQTQIESLTARITALEAGV